MEKAVKGFLIVTADTGIREKILFLVHSEPKAAAMALVLVMGLEQEMEVVVAVGLRTAVGADRELRGKVIKVERVTTPTGLVPVVEALAVLESMVQEETRVEMGERVLKVI